MKAKEIKKVVLTGNDLTLDELIAVARYNCVAELSQDTIKNIEDSRKIIDDIVANEKVIYGVTTGFGEFSKVGISKDDCRVLQENLIRSHACGYGPLFDKSYNAYKSKCTFKRIFRCKTYNY